MWYLLYTPWEFFTSVLTDSSSLEFEWQVFSSLQDSSQYSSCSQYCCCLDGLQLSSFFQVLLLLLLLLLKLNSKSVFISKIQCSMHRKTERYHISNCNTDENRMKMFDTRFTVTDNLMGKYQHVSKIYIEHIFSFEGELCKQSQLCLMTVSFLLMWSSNQKAPTWLTSLYVLF